MTVSCVITVKKTSCHIRDYPEFFSTIAISFRRWNLRSGNEQLQTDNYNFQSKYFISSSSLDHESTFRVEGNVLRASSF